MGRRPYMNLLTLGRSPYEPPEPTTEDHVEPPSLINADGYTQEYDARGHPINPSSKTLGRQLRKAKNDILSTMGIVVSGEDAMGSQKDQEKSRVLAEENDYGLAMATIDQVVMFVCPWWATSLSARIQTFRGYTHVSPVDIIRRERRTLGILGFYFSGMPVWISSFFLSVCRNHFIGAALDYVHQKISSLFDNLRYKAVVQNVFNAIHICTKGAFFLVSGQAYMFSLLQSLHILPATAIPTLSSFVPFGRSSLIQLPPLPSGVSLSSVGGYGFRLLTAPFTMIYLYVFLRPVIEGRIYRLLRRRLPKPDRPDKLSVRVALENDLIEWTVPTLGRRSEEEKSRSELSLAEEILCELVLLRDWMKGLFTWRGSRKRDSSDKVADSSWTERYESIHNRIEQTQRASAINHPDEQPPELEDASLPLSQPRPEPDSRHHTEGEMSPGDADHSSTNQVILSDEEQGITQSPLQLPEEYFMSITHPAASTENIAAPPIPSYQIPGPAAEDFHHPNSRSNTLFSHPSSPESSPLASPRVRASLVHQNSDVITMQLELLQSRRQPNPPEQHNNSDINSRAPVQTPLPPRTDQGGDGDGDGDAVDRAAAEILDSLLSQNLVDGQGEGTSGNELIPSTDGASLVQPNSDPVPRQADELQRTTTNGVVGRESTSRSPNNVSPGAVAESQPTNESTRMLPIPANTLPTFLTDRLFPYHRVTILSAHPVDSLSSHLATLITSVLFYPFESFYLRYLASTFLTSRIVLGGTIPLGVAASRFGLQKRLRPVGAWFGGGGSRDMLAYISNMILMTGLEALVSAGIWSVGTAITVLLGRKKFGWGNL